jgi:hypothetical protein
MARRATMAHPVLRHPPAGLGRGLATMRPVLTLLPDQTLRLDFEEVAYAPIASDAALGALLFTLRADAVDIARARHADRSELRLALATARAYARILDRHAGRLARAQPLLPGAVTEAEARTWFAGAAAAVPAAEQERFCWRVARRLGPEPWSDGHAAIELHNQQFGLFEPTFDAPERQDAPTAADELHAAANAHDSDARPETSAGDMDAAPGLPT